MKSDSINVQVEVDIVPSKQFDEVAKKLGYTKTKICTTRTQQGEDEYDLCVSCESCNFGWHISKLDRPFNYCPNCGAMVTNF